MHIDNAKTLKTERLQVIMRRHLHACRVTAATHCQWRPRAFVWRSDFFSTIFFHIDSFIFACHSRRGMAAAFFQWRPCAFTWRSYCEGLFSF